MSNMMVMSESMNVLRYLLRRKQIRIIHTHTISSINNESCNLIQQPPKRVQTRREQRCMHEERKGGRTCEKITRRQEEEKRRRGRRGEKGRREEGKEEECSLDTRPLTQCCEDSQFFLSLPPLPLPSPLSTSLSSFPPPHSISNHSIYSECYILFKKKLYTNTSSPSLSTIFYHQLVSGEVIHL